MKTWDGVSSGSFYSTIFPSSSPLFLLINQINASVYPCDPLVFLICLCDPYWLFSLPSQHLSSLLLSGLSPTLGNRPCMLPWKRNPSASAFPTSLGVEHSCVSWALPVRCSYAPGPRDILSVEALAVLARTVLKGSNSGRGGDDVLCLVSGVSRWGKPFCGVIWEMFNLLPILVLQGPVLFNEFHNILLFNCFAV